MGRRNRNQNSVTPGQRKVQNVIYFSLGVLGIGALIQISSLMPPLGSSLPKGMQRVDTGNEKQMKEVFFGGNPWLLFCTNKTVPDKKISKLLTKAHKKLGDEFSVGVLDCNNKLPSGNTIFERFKIKPSKSSQALVLAVNGKTKQIPKEKASTASALKSFVKKKSKVRVATVRKQKAWEKYCMNQRVCGALVVGTYEARTIQNLARLHRGVQFVVVNTTYYKLEDSQGKVFTGSNPKGDAVLHLFKRRKGGLLSTSSYSGPFTSHNMGKFVAARMGDGGTEEDLLLKKNERPELVSKSRKKKPRKTKKDKVKEAQAKKDKEAAKAEKLKAQQRRREQRRRARMDKEAESYIPQAEEEDEVELKDDEGDDDDSPAAGSGGGGATAAAADAGDGEEVDLDGDDDGDDGEEMDLDDDDGEEMDLDDD